MELTTEHRSVPPEEPAETSVGGSGGIAILPSEPAAAELLPSVPRIQVEATGSSLAPAPSPIGEDARLSFETVVIAIEPPGPLLGLAPVAFPPEIDLRVRANAEVKVPPQPTPPEATSPDRQATEQIIARARALMKGRDFRAARSLLELVIDASPEASFMIAQTFDRRQIEARRVRGVNADHRRARTFYERAARAGVPGAAQSLSGLID